jgi:hypothetical protein
MDQLIHLGLQGVRPVVDPVRQLAEALMACSASVVRMWSKVFVSLTVVTELHARLAHSKPFIELLQK